MLKQQMMKIDLLSNGFKLRRNNNEINNNSELHFIYGICRRAISSKRRNRYTSNGKIIMSSILKVDTIQDQKGNLIISKDSGGGGFEGDYFSSSSPKVFTVTVAD